MVFGFPDGFLMTSIHPWRILYGSLPLATRLARAGEVRRLLGISLVALATLGFPEVLDRYFLAGTRTAVSTAVCMPVAW